MLGGDVYVTFDRGLVGRGGAEGHVTGAATPTVDPGAGEMPVVTSPAGVTVVYVPVTGTAWPSVPVAGPDTV